MSAAQYDDRVNPLSLDPAREWWTRDEVAEHCGGITPAAVSNYVSKGLMPAPEYIGRTPMWDAEKVREWHANRPGRGRWRSGEASEA